MKVFVSWSGDTSRRVALALRDWLPLVINDVDPFVSDEDIHSGQRWQAEIAGELEATNFGVICVTKENQGARWLNFEAGALAKAVSPEPSRVIPLLFDMKLSDLVAPLSQFQAQVASQEGLRKVVTSLNAVRDRPLDNGRLKRAYEMLWPDFEAKLDEIRKTTTETASDSTSRTDRELLEEMLATVRSLARRTPTGSSWVSPSARERGRTVPLNSDHPVIDELREIAMEADENCTITLTKSPRAIGVFSEEPLPDEVANKLEERAAHYGIFFMNLPKRVPKDSSSEPQPA